MAKLESNIFNKIRLAVSRLGTRLFRNNRGLFYTLDKQRKTRAGLEPNGCSDGIGWTPIVVTPAMVGETIAVFTAIEVKTGSGRISKDQQHYIDTVLESGGIAGIARSDEDAINLINALLEDIT